MKKLCFLLLLTLFSCQKDPITSDATEPTIITSAVTGIGTTSAVSGGIVTKDGNADIIEKGVCWGTSPKPTITNSHTNDGKGSSTYTSVLSNLVENTTYYVRSYATNSAGTGYGADITFTTLKLTCGEIITYNGKTYNTVKIGVQCWFRENLNVGTRINGNQNQTNNNVIEKHCYNDEDINCEFYGGLYQWDEMMKFANDPQGICPNGWHVPSKEDFSSLSTYLGGDSISGGKIKESGPNNWASPNVGATNSSGFTALGTGKHSTEGFDGIMLFAYLWSSTPDNSNSNYSWSITPYSAGKDLYVGFGNKNNSFSIRCVKN